MIEQHCMHTLLNVIDSNMYENAMNCLVVHINALSI